LNFPWRQKKLVGFPLNLLSSWFSFFPITNMFVFFGSFQCSQCKWKTITCHSIE
jgi:hypothetical protein